MRKFLTVVAFAAVFFVGCDKINPPAPVNDCACCAVCTDNEKCTCPCETCKCPRYHLLNDVDCCKSAH